MTGESLGGRRPGQRGGDPRKFGWLGPEPAKAAWPENEEALGYFQLIGRSEVKRVTAWDSWQALGWDPNGSILWRQESGDCVSFGAAYAVAAVAAHEIIRLGEWEGFKVPYPPYLYGISRLAPEGGNGRLRGDGSLGSWMAATIQKYGVLRADYAGVPGYSGAVADAWGRSWSRFSAFVDEADDHLIRKAARLRSIADLVDACSNGYWATIASMRGYRMALENRAGKSWFVGSDAWPHQMSILAIDVEPELCFYRRNSWGNAHGKQLDGPDGGGWVTAKQLEREIEDEGTECFAYSRFDGFPSEAEKPRNYFGQRS